MAVKLSTSEKEEIRRLTQKANRRIKAFMKSYEKSGLSVIPKEVTAGFDIQHKSQFQAGNYAISRSVKFESQAEYKKHLKMLRDFEPGKATSAPTVSEYNKIQRSKLYKAISSVDSNVGDTLVDKVKKMSAADISNFWKEFQERGKRKGMEWSSEAIMAEMETLYNVRDNVDLMSVVLEKR